MMMTDSRNGTGSVDEKAATETTKLTTATATTATSVGMGAAGGAVSGGENNKENIHGRQV